MGGERGDPSLNILHSLEQETPPKTHKLTSKAENAAITTSAAAPNKHNCRKSETNLKLTSELIWDVTIPGCVAWAPE
jgi:hypothetical protein